MTTLKILTTSQAKERLKVNRYSIEAWNILINDAMVTTKIDHC